MKKILYFALAACCMAFTACSDNDEPANPANPDAPTVTDGVFILNQGNYGRQIEGSLTSYDFTTKTVGQNLFQKANGRSLGATPQAAVVYGSKMYVGMYESNVIEIIDRTSYKSLVQIQLSGAKGQNPRSLVAKSGKVYISMYNGYVSRLDTLSMKIDADVQVGPNPEIIAIKGDKLYVPNSDGMNWQVGYGTTASVIDLKTFTVEKTLTVGLNPGKFACDGDDLFLLCKGNYGDVASTLYKVADNGDLSVIAECNYFDAAGGKVYYINAPWYATEFTYGVYDSKTGKKGTFISPEAGVDSPAGIGADPVSGKVVITSYNLDNGYADYLSDGYARVYDLDGNPLGRFAAGVGPEGIIFNYSNSGK